MRQYKILLAFKLIDKNSLPSQPIGIEYFLMQWKRINAVSVSKSSNIQYIIAYINELGALGMKEESLD